MINAVGTERVESLDRRVHSDRTRDAVKTLLLDAVSQSMMPLLSTAP